MLTLEEIMRRFIARRSAEMPTAAVEPVKPMLDEAPIVINGMGELVGYMADQQKRIAELEAELEKQRIEREAATK